MQEVSSSRESMDSLRRPSKRQRVSRTTYRPSPAAIALLDRVSSVRSYAVDLRDDHQALIDDFDRRAAAKRAASRAAAKVNPGPPAEDVQKFSRGDSVKKPAKQSGGNIRHASLGSTPPPAMTLLVEQDAPEKSMVENSVIWRALMINRRNAELARERLPKQPEAQRGKTHWDYLLDEAVWLANDFREERKWKMQMAKKVSKMVMQYHAQRTQRAERAKRDEMLRILRLANGVARDVRKFWSQIREVADYRQSVLRDAELAKEREDQLKYLLRQTEAYTNVLATNLSKNDEVSDSTTRPVRVSLEKNEGRAEHPSSPTNYTPSGTSGSKKRSRVEFEHTSESHSQEHAVDNMGPVSDEEHSSEIGASDSDDVDDEATLDATEKMEEKDPNEINRLEGDADRALADVLREQGIDLDAYKNDVKSYAESSSEGDTSSDEEVEESGDESGANPKVGHVSDESRSDSHNSLPISEKNVQESVLPSGSAQNGGARQMNISASDQSIADQQDVSASAARNGTLHENKAQPMNIDAAVAAYMQKGEPEDILATSGGDVAEAVGTLSIGGTEGSVPAALLGSPVNSGVEKEPVMNGSVVGDRGSNARRLEPPSRLLRGSLRDYQRIGMEWLVTMYNQKLNGILADEMGLGKTIQTISLLAWLAVERNIWGPHLVVVPTSVMINWEVEFKKFLPGFKVLTYYGTMKERRAKRQGWSKPNSFHVCITSYSLVVQDASALRRKKWVYLILDEAHNIKNFQSQRWQTLLNFPSKRRLLLTGTPLQNSVMELWSLMHFLMPDVFRSHAEFKDWFSKPLTSMVEGESSNSAAASGVVANLHRVLRPFLLRRLKRDVEKGLPGKFEHILTCPLSKRQRQLYEDFMARSDIKQTLQSGDFIGVMNVLMQLRKVCNHPDLFEGRPIVSPFSASPVFYPVPRLVVDVVQAGGLGAIDLSLLGLDLASEEANGWPGMWFESACLRLSASGVIQTALEQVRDDDFIPQTSSFRESFTSEAVRQAGRRAAVARRATLRRNTFLSELRTRRRGMLGSDVISAATMTTSSLLGAVAAHRRGNWQACTAPVLRALYSMADMGERANTVSERFGFSVAAVMSPVVEIRYIGDDRRQGDELKSFRSICAASAPVRSLFRSAEVRSKVTLPDSRLVQWDCGKLQVLDSLMRKLKSGGHRVLIFTQMTRMLDVLESFLNLHAYRYLRLDGGTRTEERQKLVERFNTDRRVFCMILTTRAGGLGLNLTGADTVVFYDTDYNPSMDAQAQDRAHRIGQTKPVHIYRLVSKQTVEENILKRAQQKRNLESLVISEAGFTTEGFRQKLDVMALVQPSGNGVLQQTPNKLHTGVTGAARGSSRSPEGAVFDESGTVLKPSDVETVRVGSSVMKSVSDGDLPHANDVDSTLLAYEDERELEAVKKRNREERLLKAEFSETLDEPLIPPEVTSGDLENGEENVEVTEALTPVQRLALRFVESEALRDCDQGSGGSGDQANEEDVPDLGDSTFPEWHKDFSVEEMLKRHRRDESSSDSLSGGCLGVSGPNSASYSESDPEGRIGQDEEDELELLYELDTSEAGQGAYLKALTDTDADIKLYLPLRDGDPEELKKSAVVYGTAAAGLECAEDAAFFPHAYNRMSRTPFATRRQKEKAAANLAKRLAEERRLEKQAIHEAAELAKRKAAAASSKVADANPEKARDVQKSKAPTTVKGSSSTVLGKRYREPVSAVKRAGPSAPSSQAQSSMHEGVTASGLFPKQQPKKRLKLGSAFYGKAGIAAGLNISKEEIGVNDRWTTAEDQQLLDLVAMYNKNMQLVSDALSSHPQVAAGHRISRGPKRCIDRMRTLAKDAKATPPVVRAVEKDDDTLREHSKALGIANRAVRVKPPAWIRVADPGSASAPHPSHLKVVNDVTSREATRIPAGPPTMAAVSGQVRAPPYHRSGFKPSDCTPHAVNRKRRPFMRNRVGSERRPGQSTAQSQKSTQTSASQEAAVLSKASPLARATPSVRGTSAPLTTAESARGGAIRSTVVAASQNHSAVGKSIPASRLQVGRMATPRPTTPAMNRATMPIQSTTAATLIGSAGAHPSTQGTPATAVVGSAAPSSHALNQALVQPVISPVAQPTSQAASHIAARVDMRPGTQSTTKAMVRPATQHTVQPVVQPPVPHVVPPVGPQVVQSVHQQMVPPVSQHMTRTLVQPSAQPVPQRLVQPAHQPIVQSAARSVVLPVTQPVSGPRPMIQQVVRSEAQPVAQVGVPAVVPPAAPDVLAVTPSVAALGGPAVAPVSSLAVGPTARPATPSRLPEAAPLTSAAAKSTPVGSVNPSVSAVNQRVAPVVNSRPGGHPPGAGASARSVTAAGSQVIVADGCGLVSGVHRSPASAAGGAAGAPGTAEMGSSEASSGVAAGGVKPNSVGKQDGETNGGSATK